MSRTKKLVLAALVGLAIVVPGASASQKPPASIWGERIYKKQVLIPLYNWDTGKIMIGSTPVSCQYIDTCAPGAAKMLPKSDVQPFYLVVYPKGVDVPVECSHIPMDNCPDHGPLIAQGAKQLVPSVYGNGVLGHEHLCAPLNSKDYRVIGIPTLVLFKTRAAAHELITTRKQVLAAVKAGKAFLYPVPQYEFVNLIVPRSWYAKAKPVKPISPSAPAMPSMSMSMVQPGGGRP